MTAQQGDAMSERKRPRRSLWMFGLESEEPSYEQRAAAAARLSDQLGVELTAPRIRRPTRWNCAPRGSARRISWPRSASPARGSALTTPMAPTDRCPACSATTRTRPTWSRTRAPRRRWRRSCPRARTAATARSPTGAAAPRSAASPRRRTRDRSSRSPWTSWTRSSRSTRSPGPLSSRPGRWPGSGGPAPAARLHAAALPAELLRVDARRLDRDPVRRALRDQPHPHR